MGKQLILVNGEWFDPDKIYDVGILAYHAGKLFKSNMLEDEEDPADHKDDGIPADAAMMAGIVAQGKHNMNIFLLKQLLPSSDMPAIQQAENEFNPVLKKVRTAMRAARDAENLSKAVEEAVEHVAIGSICCAVGKAAVKSSDCKLKGPVFFSWFFVVLGIVMVPLAVVFDAAQQPCGAFNDPNLEYWDDIENSSHTFWAPQDDILAQETPNDYDEYTTLLESGELEPCIDGQANPRLHAYDLGGTGTTDFEILAYEKPPSRGELTMPFAVGGLFTAVVAILLFYMAIKMSTSRALAAKKEATKERKKLVEKY